MKEQGNDLSEIFQETTHFCSQMLTLPVPEQPSLWLQVLGGLSLQY